MEIVLIIGESDQGKSSLVRCLTGKSRDMHNHPNIKNILTLDWNQVGFSQNTLVLISSINEGNKYTTTGIRAYIGLSGTVAIHPLDLADMLADYSNASLKKPATKAILCISSSVRKRGWAVADYHNILANPQFLAQHSITNTVLIGPNVTSLNWPNTTVVSGLGTPVNTVANTARTNLPLI